MAKHIDIVAWYEWLENEGRNPIRCMTYAHFKDELQGWHKKLKGVNAMIVARGALGKTYYCAHSMPNAFLCHSKLTAYKLYYRLWKKMHDTYVIDDYTDLCEEKGMGRLLRSVLNTDDERAVVWDTGRTGIDKDMPDHITTTAKFALILNDAPINDGTNTFKAYVSRFKHIVFTPSNAEVFRYASEVCKFRKEVCDLLAPLVNTVKPLDLRMFRDTEKGFGMYDRKTWEQIYAPKLPQEGERTPEQIKQMVRDSQTMFACRADRLRYCGISPGYYHKILSELDKKNLLGGPIVPNVPPEPIPAPKPAPALYPVHTVSWESHLPPKPSSKDKKKYGRYCYMKKHLLKKEIWLRAQYDAGKVQLPKEVADRQRGGMDRLEAIMAVQQMVRQTQHALGLTKE